MALVDFEAAWHQLAAEVSGRQGIGRDALFALMKRLEVEHALEEGVSDRLFRRYGVLLSEDLRAAARGEEQVGSDGDAASSASGQVPRLGTRGVPGDRTSMIEREQTNGSSNGRSAEARRLARHG